MYTVRMRCMIAINRSTIASSDTDQFEDPAIQIVPMDYIAEIPSLWDADYYIYDRYERLMRKCFKIIKDRSTWEGHALKILTTQQLICMIR